nr:hypothetical protein [Spirosoma foliorum]
MGPPERMYAELSLQNEVIKEALAKKCRSAVAVGPAERRVMVKWMVNQKQISQRKASGPPVRSLGGSKP